MIIVIGGIKGGSGKTTLATNLTVLRSLKGSKVLLIDADEQRSAYDWACKREGMNIKTTWSTIQLSGKYANSQIMKMVDDYEDIIVDAGGRDTTSQRSVLSIADLFIIPFKPRSFDIWTLGTVKSLISEVRASNSKLKCLSVINQADSRGEDNQQALDILNDCSDFTCFTGSIGHRKSFANAAADGLGVVELKSQDKKATGEIKELYEYIYNTCLTDVKSV